MFFGMRLIVPRYRGITTPSNCHLSSPVLEVEVGDVDRDPVRGLIAWIGQRASLLFDLLIGGREPMGMLPEMFIPRWDHVELHELVCGVSPSRTRPHCVPPVRNRDRRTRDMARCQTSRPRIRFSLPSAPEGRGSPVVWVAWMASNDL